MPQIRSAQIVAFYLFDVAETVNLQAIPALVGGPAVAARLTPKATTPPYVQYDKPPLSFDGDLVGAAELEQRAERLCRNVTTRLKPALSGLRDEFLSEDYIVFAVHELDRPLPADELIARHGE